MKLIAIILLALLSLEAHSHHQWNLVLLDSEKVVADGFASYDDCHDAKAIMKASYDDSLYCVTEWVHKPSESN